MKANWNRQSNFTASRPPAGERNPARVNGEEIAKGSMAATVLGRFGMDTFD